MRDIQDYDRDAAVLEPDERPNVAKTSLVMRAMSIPTRSSRRSISDEEIELALAWAKGDVTTAQVMRVLFPATQTGDAPAKGRMALALREAIRRGRLVEAQRLAGAER